MIKKLLKNVQEFLLLFTNNYSVIPNSLKLLKYSVNKQNYKQKNITKNKQGFYRNINITSIISSLINKFLIKI